MAEVSVLADCASCSSAIFDHPPWFPNRRAHYKLLLCVLLCNLLEEAQDVIDQDLYSFLQAKLARRLAKLEVEKGQASPNVRAVYDASFAALGAIFSESLKKSK